MIAITSTYSKLRWEGVPEGGQVEIKSQPTPQVRNDVHCDMLFTNLNAPSQSNEGYEIKHI